MRKRRKGTSTSKDVKLGYSGEVTIKVVKNDKVVKVVDGHNTGTVRLFDYLAKCLCCLYEASYAPRFLNVFHAENSSDVDIHGKESLTGVIPLASSSFTSDSVNSISTANLTFTIPGELFSGTEDSPNLFALYSYVDYLNQDNPLAVIYLDTDLGTITNDTNLILVWKLSISNIEVE